jgi:ankyrin repeat protein
MAVSEGHTETAGLLLDRGAAIEAKDNDGKTALLLAATWGRTDTVRLLLVMGAAADATDISGCTPLECAVLNGHTHVVELLMNVGRDVDQHDSRAFLYASVHGHTAIIAMLLQRGVDIGARLEGRRALGWAIENGHTDAAALIEDRMKELVFTTVASIWRCHPDTPKELMSLILKKLYR